MHYQDLEGKKKYLACEHKFAEACEAKQYSLSLTGLLGHGGRFYSAEEDRIGDLYS